MDKERLKLIVRNLKSLVDALESEVHSDVDAYRIDSFSAPPTDYDEAWDDADGYPDKRTNFIIVTQEFWEHTY